METHVNKTLKVDKPYLPYPVNCNGKPCFIILWDNDKILFEFYTLLDFENISCWHCCDMTKWMGRTIQLEVLDDKISEKNMELLGCSDTFPGMEYLYKEHYRPQLHFSYKRGILSDPNAVFYYKGKYHMFTQHQPYTNEWGDWQEHCNFGWGHAVSDDLIHWKELCDELIPDEFGPAFSGTGFVDRENASGFKSGEDDPILMYYTAAGGKGIRTMHLRHEQRLVYSVDGGKTFIPYEHNPVVGFYSYGNRDPKVIWHQESKQWIMLLYTDFDEKYLVFHSPDPFHFELASDFKWDNHECADIFLLPVNGDRNDMRYVIWGVTGRYEIVDFNGSRIIPLNYSKNISPTETYRAAQTMVHPEDGRCIQFFCFPCCVNSSSISNCAGIPNEVFLMYERGDYFVHLEPVKEIELLRINGICCDVQQIQGSKNFAACELMDIELTLSHFEEAEVEIHGVTINVNRVKKQLSCYPLAEENSKGDADLEVVDTVRLRVIVDRHIITVYEFSNHIIMPLQVRQTFSDTLEIRSADATLEKLNIYELDNIWNN